MNAVVRVGREHQDVDVVHGYLTRSYWAKGITRERVARSLEGSLCFGLFLGERQVGFARVVTDRTTFAYLCDVFVLEQAQGRGLGKQLIAAVRAHPDLCGLRRFMLTTRDAHGLYEQFGFERTRTSMGVMTTTRGGTSAAESAAARGSAGKRREATRAARRSRAK